MASLGDVQHTFSSWDSCMSKDYCKWPAIVGIIVGCLVVLSVLFCVARCLCFGAECCACCCSCFSCCCPGRSRRGRGGYKNYQSQPPPPPPPMPFAQQYSQYHSHMPPMYHQPSPYRGPQTAMFDAPTKSARYNEDALPPMPSWDNAATRHVEEEPVEMERIGDAHQAQQQHLLAEEEQLRRYDGRNYPQSPTNAESAQSYGQSSRGQAQNAQDYTQSRPDYAPSAQGADHYRAQEHAYNRDMGNMSAAPRHNYDQHRQYAPSMSPVSPSSYAQSATMPPSYRTREPSLVSPIQANHNPMPNRRPVNGSWRDV